MKKTDATELGTRSERGRMYGMAACGAVALGLAISCAGTQTPKDRITDPGELLFNGQTVSGVDCYKCHNGNATGTWRGPDLIKRLPNLQDPAISDAIYKGPGMMPAYKGKLDERQVAEITAWLRSRSPAPAAK